MLIYFCFIDIPWYLPTGAHIVAGKGLNILKQQGVLTCIIFLCAHEKPESQQTSDPSHKGNWYQSSFP